MVERNTRARRRSGDKIGGRVVLAAALLGLAGCNPVETYRRWTGIAANDPNPATAPNTRNLAAGEALGYPSLATVPPPPNRALTSGELDRLTKSLIGERTAAKNSSEHLQVAAAEATAPPPLPPPPLFLPSPPAAPATGPGTPPAPGSPPGSAAVAAAPPGGAKAAAAPPAKGPRKAGEPPEPGPLESSLRSPQITGLPQPEQARTAPPPPAVLALPARPGASGEAGAHLPAPPANPPLPATIGSAQFEPPPPPPVLPPPPMRTATAAAAPKSAKPPAIAYTKVAEIAFRGDSTALSDADRHALEVILPRYREKPGPVRIIGYAGITGGAAEQLDAYRVALDRARVVAAALSGAGIPAGKIETQAAPAGGASERGRAEILLGQ